MTPFIYYTVMIGGTFCAAPPPKHCARAENLLQKHCAPTAVAPQNYPVLAAHPAQRHRQNTAPAPQFGCKSTVSAPRNIPASTSPALKNVRSSPSKSSQIHRKFTANSPRRGGNGRGQEARCISLRSLHPEFRPLGCFAPVAVNSGLRPETREMAWPAASPLSLVQAA